MTYKDYNFKDNYLDLHGYRYHYIDEGEGDPVVMVHGNPTWSYYYRHVISALKSNYRTIVPDHMGCGMSDKPSDKDYHYTLEERVKDLEALLDHLKVGQKVSLIVHDWGGMIGMAYATRHIEKISKIVVLNTSGFLKPASKKMPWLLTMFRNKLVGALLVRGFNSMCRGAASMCVTKTAMAGDVRDGFIGPYDSWEHRIAVHRFIQDIPLAPGDTSYDLVKQVDDNLKHLSKIPMMICWGMKDFVFDHHFLKEWERRMPHAEVHRFEDCGHYILEDARDEVIGHIKEFLSKDK